jgi:hypothetical protein
MISDTEKARRYRRKLIDLVDVIERWYRSQTITNERAVWQEASTVKHQLETEDRLQRSERGI